MGSRTPRRLVASHWVSSRSVLYGQGLVGAGLVAGGLHAWRALGHDLGGFVALFGAALVAATVVFWKHAGKRWELDGDVITLRHGHVVTQRRVGELVDVARGLGTSRVLVFVDGRFESVPLAATGSATLLQELTAIVQDRPPGARPAVAADGDAPWIEVATLTVPDRCVACGAPHASSVDLKTERSLDLVAIVQHVERRVAVPVCRRHALISWVPTIVLVAVPAALIALAIALDGSVETPVQSWIVIAALACFAVLLLAVTRRGDLWALGLSLGALAPDLLHARVHARDPALLREIVALSARRRQEQERAASEH